MKERDCFWFSQKALDWKYDDARRRNEKVRINYCKLDSGDVVLYTEWGHSDTPSSKWDDIVFLGEGVYDHFEEV